MRWKMSNTRRRQKIPFLVTSQLLEAKNKSRRVPDPGGRTCGVAQREVAVSGKPQPKVDSDVPFQVGTIPCIHLTTVRFSLPRHHFGAVPFFLQLPVELRDHLPGFIYIKWAMPWHISSPRRRLKMIAEPTAIRNSNTFRHCLQMGTVFEGRDRLKNQIHQPNLGKYDLLLAEGQLRTR
jgi:hypothetical protein